jgi:CubicO group peptidase (beta-lactamase class C family)
MMRYRRCSTRSMIVALFLAVSVACSAQPPSGPATSVPPTPVASSAVPRAALGTVIDDYLAHGSVNLQNIRAVLVTQRGELLAERYYHSDAAAYAEIHSATKSVMSTLIGIALTKGDLRSLDQTLGELLPQHRTAMSKSSARTTIRQLLTMTGGWTAFYDADTATPELVRRVLNAGPEVDPGTFV